MNKSSGRLLIAGILAVGFVAAGASWWFRYQATHRAATFWGPDAAVLIRDAPRVEALELQRADAGTGGGGSPSDEELVVGGTTWRITSRQDVSGSPGMTHLRNALLEDRSFVWPARVVPADTRWARGLRFSSGAERLLTILFSSDYRWATAHGGGESRPESVSCEPIADGLSQVLAEWTRREAGDR